MRSLLLLGLVALLAAPAVSAQATFGLKLGVQAANVSVDDGGDDGGDDDFEGRLGFLGGVTADIAFTPMLSVRPEVIYTQKGFRLPFDSGISGENGDLSYRLDYVEVPLLLAYTARTASGFDFGAEVGPTLAYRLGVDASCNGNDNLCEGFDSDEASQDFDDELEQIDIGGALGVTAGSGPFGVGVRYTRGFSNIATTESDDDTFTVTTSTFAATLNYRFGAQ